MEMPKTISRPNEPGICALLYGDSGSGKTFTAFTFPEPIYVIDTEMRAMNTKFEHFRDKKIEIWDPIEYRTNSGPDVEIFDQHATIENCAREVIWFANAVKTGEIKKGTLVIDSVTDIWQFCQSWGIHELAKYQSKEGVKKADTMLMRVTQQTDWRLINQKHCEIVLMLRKLLPHGINIVLTAREEQIPQYVIDKLGAQESSLKDKIRCQKDVPFCSDVIFQMKKFERNGTTQYAARLEKLGAKKVQNQIVQELTYDKIRDLMNPKQPETKS